MCFADFPYYNLYTLNKKREEFHIFFLERYYVADEKK